MGFDKPPAGINEGLNTEWHSYLDRLLLNLNCILKKGIFDLDLSKALFIIFMNIIIFSYFSRC